MFKNININTESIKGLERDIKNDKAMISRGSNKNVLITCPICNKDTSFNGCTSHSRIHPEILDIKTNYIRQKYKFQYYCFCGNKINVHSKWTEMQERHTHFCSKQCYRKAKKIVTQYYNLQKRKKHCVICGKPFIASDKIIKTCSSRCYKRIVSLNSKKMWKERTKNEYNKVCAKIAKATKNRDYICKAWNKGITGSEYLKHYKKEDGSNSLYESLKNNDAWYKKTSIEKKFDNLLKRLNANYQYSFFTQNAQFDFLLSTDNIVYIIELDGDYWHKSRRLDFNEKERKMKRLEDKLKSNKINNIKNTDKKWVVLRIWEYDINNNFNLVTKWVKELLKGKEHEKTIREVKKNYSNWS